MASSRNCTQHWAPLNNGISTTTKQWQKRFKEYDDLFSIVSSDHIKKLNTIGLAVSFLCFFVLTPYVLISRNIGIGIVLAVVFGSIFVIMLLMRYQDHSFHIEKTGGSYYFGKKSLGNSHEWSKQGFTSNIMALQIIQKRVMKDMELHNTSPDDHYELNLVFSENRRLHVLELTNKANLEAIASNLGSHYEIPVLQLNMFGQVEILSG